MRSTARLLARSSCARVPRSASRLSAARAAPSGMASLKPDWSQLLGEGEAQVQERQLARLWAGYGSVKELTVKGASGTRRLVAKAVDPPKGRAGDVGHQRKLDSYAVEAAFYRACAPRLAELAASLGLDAAGPSSGGSSAGGGANGAHAPAAAASSGDLTSDLGPQISWCWAPQPVVVEAAPPRHFLFVLGDLRAAFPQQPHAYDLEEAKVALEWLASFHAAWWEEEPPEGLWQDGCYWHLATRQEELAQIGGSWGELKKAAAAVDAALRGVSENENEPSGGGGARRFATLCHGDAKSANFMFSRDGRAAAAYDFQYCGAGYGMKDVVYLLVSSTDESLLTSPGGERQLLGHYHAALTARLRQLGKGDAAAAYDLEAVMVPHYELAVVDYCRFMAGWGFWGASDYASRRCREVLGRLPAVLKAAAAAAGGGGGGGGKR